MTYNNIEHKVTSKVLEFAVINADEKISSMLKIEVGDFVYLINRVRYVDKEPLVMEKTYMPLSVIPGVKMKDVEGSIYNYIREELGFKIQSAHSTIRADKSSESDRKYLKLKSDEPIIEVERVAYLDNGKAFEYSFARHRYDKYVIQNYYSNLIEKIYLKNKEKLKASPYFMLKFLYKTIKIYDFGKVNKN